MATLPQIRNLGIRVTTLPRTCNLGVRVMELAQAKRSNHYATDAAKTERKIYKIKI